MAKAKVVYIKCPRCELNYIDKRQELCDICKAELGLESSIILDDIDDEDNVIMCPVCKRVIIHANEEMCESCASAKELEDEPLPDPEDDSWKKFLDGDETDPEVAEDIPIPLEELQDEEYNQQFEEEEDYPIESYDDDFEEVNIDDYDYDDDDDDSDSDDDDEDY